MALECVLERLDL